MAIEEAIHINVDTNAGEAEKQLDALNEKLRQSADEYLKLTEAQKKSPFGKDLAKQMEGLQAKINGASGATNQLANETEEATKKVIPLKTQLKQLKDQLALLEEGSPAFIEMAKKAGDLQGQIEAANNTTKLFKDSIGEQQFAGVIGTLELVTAGFGAVQGAQALFGAESEDLQKILTKVNATMLILNGLQSIQANLQKDSAAYIFITTTAQNLYTAAVGASTGALKSFRIALAATGLGALVVLLGVLVAKWDSIKSLLNIGVNPATKKLADETHRAAEASRAALEAFDLEERKLRALEAAELDIIAARREKTQQALDATDKELAAQEKVLNETVNNYLKGQARAAASPLGGASLFNSLFGVSEEDVEKTIEKLNEIKKLREEFSVSLLELNKKENQEYEKQIKTNLGLSIEAMSEGIEKQLEAERVRYMYQMQELEGQHESLRLAEVIHQKNIAKIKNDFYEKALEDDFKYRELLISNMKDGTRKQKLAEELSFEQRKKDLEGNYKAILQLEIEFDRNLKKIFADSFESIQSRYSSSTITSAFKQSAKNLQDEILKNGETIEKNADLFNQRQLEKKELFLKREQDILAARQQLYQASSEAFGNLVQLVATEGKGLTDTQKTFALIQIGIDTARALSSALAATYGTTPEPIVAAIRYATIAANIVATANRIKQTLSSGHHSNVAPPSAPTGNSTAPGQQQGVSTSQVVVQNTITIPERDLRRASVNAAERNRGAIVVV